MFAVQRGAVCPPHGALRTFPLGYLSQSEGDTL